MAITRSQQAKQMLQDGGMLVSPSKDGKRPGYSNPNEDRAREEAANRREQNRAANYQRSQTFDAPKQSTFSSEVEDEINDKDRDFTRRQLTNNITTDDGKKDKPKKKKDKFIFPSIFNREFMFRAANKLPRFGAATIKDKQNAYKAYLQSMGVDNIPGSLDSDDPFDFFKSDAFNYVPSAGDEKFDANIQDYGDFVLEKFGAPAIKFGGNVGNIEVFKKADGTFDYRQKQKDDGPQQEQDPCKGPNPPAYCFIGDNVTEETDPTNIFARENITPRIAGSLFAADGGRIGADEGGIMKASYGYDDAMGEAFEEFLRLKKIKEIPEDMEFDEYLDQLDIDVPYSRKDRGEQRTMAQEGGMMNVENLEREAFLLGGIAKGLKKAVRGVKKIAKSPIGKAALLGAGMFGIPGTTFGGLLGRASFGGAAQGMFGSFGPVSALKKLGIMKTQMEPGLFERIGPLSKLNLPMAGIFAASALAGLMTPKEEDDEFDIAKYYAQNQLQPSQSVRGVGSEFDFYKYNLAEGGTPRKEPVAKKTLPLIDMDGMEKDYRETGGFVDMGRMEKADDVPARLSKNEFVFTADAVRNAGEGDIDKGAEVMYNMMKNLEAGGEVSEESQGLEGAREMFQTSQRLGEVI